LKRQVFGKNYFTKNPKEMVTHLLYNKKKIATFFYKNGYLQSFEVLDKHEINIVSHFVRPSILEQKTLRDEVEQKAKILGIDVVLDSDQDKEAAIKELAKKVEHSYLYFYSETLKMGTYQMNFGKDRKNFKLIAGLLFGMDTDELTLNYIFRNWYELPDFHKNRFLPSQILADLLNIVHIFKNKSKNATGAINANIEAYL